jgi:thymidine phosphorylase
MLILGTVASTLDAAQAMMRDAIASGKALRKFEEIVSAQGGDVESIRDPSRLPRARYQSEFVADRDGVVQSVDPRAIGHGIIALGGGRTRMEDSVDHAVGFVIVAKPGMRVVAGQTLGTIHARREEDLAVGRAVPSKAIVVGDGVPEGLPLVSHLVTGRGVTEV